VKRRRVRRSGGRITPQQCCVLCGALKGIEQHHVAGRNHVLWFTLPLCVGHHREITRRLQAAGVEMRRARTTTERIARAQQAVAVFQWWLGEELMK
jgi:hypothetical protein